MDYEDQEKFLRTTDLVCAHLEDYLAEHGISTAKNFSCISPDHDDSNPSMGIVPSQRNLFHCFGCLVSGNIFHAAHWLEGKPLVGRAFIDDNLNYLARKYGIEPVEFNLTEQDIHKLNAEKIFTRMADFMKKAGHLDLSADRGWEDETCSALGIFTLDDYGAAATSICNQLGLSSREDLFNAGLSPKLFGPKRITFTLKDPYGKVIGFACRNTDYEEWKARADAGDKGVPPEKLRKYDYTAPHAGIFVKEKFIYNLNNARKEGGRVYIFEGQGSVITALQNDLKNVVATCGPFTKEMFKELQRYGINDIILAFDYDRNESGQKRTSAVIKDVIGISSDLRVRVLNWRPKIEELKIQERSVDPDWFIQEFGIEQFKDIPLISTFEWQIEMLHGSGLSPEEKAEQLVPVIMQEASLITQDRYGKQLAAYLDVDEGTILDQIKELRRAKDNSIIKRQEKILNKFKKNFFILEDATKRMELTRDFYDSMEKVQPNPTIITIDDDMVEFEKIISDIHNPQKRLGIKVGFDEIEKRLGGDIEVPGLFWYIGAEPNTGKTALIQTLGVGILQSEERPVKVLYFINDDTKKDFVHRMLANMGHMHINVVKRFYEYENHPRAVEFKKKLEASKEQLRDWQGKGMLRMYQDAFSLDMILNNIRKELKNCKGPMVVFVDSFTRIDNIHSDSERQRVEFTSQEFKKVVNSWGEHGVAIICTSEVNKPYEVSRRTNARSRPKPKDLKGSGKMEFDATLVTMLDNKMHRLPQHYINDSNSFWVPKGETSGSVDNHKPIIDLHFDKNKRSEFKGCIHLKLRPETSRMFAEDAPRGNITIPQETA